MIEKIALRYASRWMLPLEIWMAGVLFAAALSSGGYLGFGRLYEAAAMYGSPFWCFFFLATVACSKLMIAGSELAIGRRWDVPALFLSVSARCCLAFIAVSQWAYISYLLWSTPGDGSASPFIYIAPWCLIGNVFVYYQNYMVRCLLNPALSTWALECRIMADRREFR